MSKKFDRDRTTINYWVQLYLKNDVMGKMPVVKSGRPKKDSLNVVREKFFWEKQVKPKTACKWCGKPKEEFNPKMRLTHFCSIKCWDKKMMGVKNYLL